MSSQNTIPFGQLTQYNDSNSVVMVGINPDSCTPDIVEGHFKEIGFMPTDATVIGLKKIDGNVLGDEGRSDILVITTDTTFHPIVRLQLGFVKWTSDFIDNYGEEYGHLHGNEETEE